MRIIGLLVVCIALAQCTYGQPIAGLFATFVMVTVAALTVRL